ncbi:MAG: hypothetical protein LBB89_08300 [Treponema sp.]|jgi:hypothetical protein|nr:hypothetical protein [Treponema sp.]
MEVLGGSVGGFYKRFRLPAAPHRLVCVVKSKGCHLGGILDALALAVIDST